MSGRKAKKKGGRRKGGSLLSTILLVLVLLLGVGIMAYPTVSDWWNSLHQTRAIVSYAAAVEEVDTSEIDALIEAARAYNATIPQKENVFRMTEEELETYRSLLDMTGTGIIGYVEVPSIDVYLPVYHGTDESVLQVAVGHLDWTSLPVGGESTHAVMSGHRGLPRAKLFTDLDKVKIGDTFTITVLNETLAYEVDQIRIVLPVETDDLQIVEGEDYCTLVTCTPYGINTHRLLVRGHRMALEPEEKPVVVTADAVRIPNGLSILVVGIPLLFFFLMVLLMWERARRRPYSRRDLERLLEEDKEDRESE